MSECESKTWTRQYRDRCERLEGERGQLLRSLIEVVSDPTPRALAKARQLLKKPSFRPCNNRKLLESV